MAKAAGGRPVIYGPKNGTTTIRALALTKAGQRMFEQARQQLKALAKWKADPSDADVIEFLVRDRML